MEVGIQPKEGCVFQRSSCLMGQQDLEARDTSAVLPGQPAFLSARHALVARGKMGAFPSVTDSMSFNSKFRRVQIVYTIGYKYIKCSVLKKICVCASVWTWRWPVSFCHFYNGRTLLGAIIRTVWCFCSLCWLEMKPFCEHSTGVGFVPQTLLEVR